MNWRKIIYFISLTKPIVTVSVFYTWLLVYFVALPKTTFDIWRFLLEAIVIIFGISFGNALNNYFDRDIDAIMRRTRFRRVLPRGLLTLKEAKTFIIILGITSVSLVVYASILHGYLVALLYGLAMLTYVYLYTIVLKRRTWTSILIAAIAYSCVLLHAWYVASGTVTLTSIIIAMLGYTWVLSHLWAAALNWAEDYALANIPTISVTFWSKPKLPYIATFTSTLTTCLLAITPALLSYVTPFYVPVVVIAFLSELIILIRLALRDWRFAKELTFKLYKLTYPVLAITITSIALAFILS